MNITRMDERDEIIIEPGKSAVSTGLGGLWRYRELLYFLVWRDVKVKYKQTALGVAWAVLQPALAMIIFSVLFGRLANLPSDGIPYPVFVLAGLLPWNYFASVLGQSTLSLVANANLISKIYFPRVIIPVSSASAALIDLVIASVVLAVMMFWYGTGLSAGVVLIPVLVLLTMMTAVGFGAWLSALNVRYRDIQYAVPFLIQVWMFATPVIYPRSLLGDEWGWLVYLNPMSGVIEAFRPALFGNREIPWGGLSISVAVGLFVFVTGMAYFRKVERHFADII